MRRLEKNSDEELARVVHNGLCVKQLMTEHNFMAKTFLPAFELEMNDLVGSLEWTPGTTDSTNEKIALDRVYKSGVLLGMRKLWEHMNRYKNDGVEAEKEVGLRETKKKEKDR